MRISPAKLQKLAGLETGYIYFTKPKKDGTLRQISAPIPPLKSAQSRIANLLSRVAAPGYLFAPVEGKSYVDNAAHHKGAKVVHLLDIEDFFPSCTINKVIWFFSKKMECSLDVSIILSKIVTHNGALPQGSPCSPILAFLAYVDMWEDINSVVTLSNCKLSVYADDLTISGEKVPRALVWSVKKLMRKHGHRVAANKERSKFRKPAEITGVILTGQTVAVPNRQRQKLHAARTAIKAAKSSIDLKKLELQLRGRIAQIKQIEKGNKEKPI